MLARYLTFCLEVLVMLKKDKVNFKIYEFTIWEKSSCIHILPNISKNKGNQTVKFGQLIECSVKNIFLKNHTQNLMQKLSQNLFLKNQNWTYLLINSPKFCTVSFYFMPCWMLSKYIDSKVQTTWLCLKFKFFKKQEEIWN